MNGSHVIHHSATDGELLHAGGALPELMNHNHALNSPNQAAVSFG